MRPVSSHSKGGAGTYFSYPDSQTIEISDDFGRVITARLSDGVVSAIEGPTLSATYENEVVDFPPLNASRLREVSLWTADGAQLSSKNYLYEHTPQSYFSFYWLTGVIENGRQYANYAYDRSGRVVVSEHADGADRHTFEYPTEANRIIEDPLGTKRKYTLTKVGSSYRVSQIDQPGGAGCAPAAKAFEYSYYGLRSQTGFDGTKTCYWTNGRGLETGRVEGKAAGEACGSIGTKLASGQRKISTLWHPEWDVEVGIAEPLKITRYIYNGEKDTNGAVLSCAENGTLPGGLPLAVICKKIEHSTTDTSGAAGFKAVTTGVPRVASYTYNQFGQLITTSEPGREGTYTYYPDSTGSHTKGDLWKFENLKDQVTEYLEYTPTGFPLRTREANGLVTVHTYDPMGRMLRRVHAADTSAQSATEFEYDQFGLLTQVRNPDGTATRYGYDAAHRLTEITDPSENVIHYTLDNAGNRVSEEIRDSSGRMIRKITRTFDALNRVSSTSTGAQ
jgi:YD repeat-containing protein